MKRATFDFKPAIRELEIATRGSVNNGMLGGYKSVFRGHGLEFDSFRTYAPDDDAGMIDWKASKRANQVLVKQFVEERNQTIYFLIDVSETMLHGSSQGKLKIQYAAEVAASLCYAAIRSGDSVGYCMFSDKIVVDKKPQRGLVTYHDYTTTIVDSRYYGGSCNLKLVLQSFLRNVVGTPIIFILSDFIGSPLVWEDALKQLRSRCDTIAILIHDLYDHTLPGDDVYLLLEHPTTGEQTLINAQENKQFFEQRARAYDTSLKDTLRRCRVDHIHMETTEHFVKPLLTFIRERQLRVK